MSGASRLQRRDRGRAAELSPRAGAVEAWRLAGGRLRRGGTGSACRAGGGRRRHSRSQANAERHQRFQKLIAERREALFDEICATASFAVAIAPPARIDRDNILRASLWALARAVRACPKPQHVFVDGRDQIEARCDCEAVIGGDGIVLHCRGLDRRQGRARPTDGALAEHTGLWVRAPYGLRACRRISRRWSASGRPSIIAALSRRGAAFFQL